MNIKIELKNINQALNEFNSNMLSNALDEYIINSLSHANLYKKNLNLEVKGLSNKEEQEKLNKVIHEHYSKKFKIFELHDNIDDYFKIIFGCFGIVAVILSNKFSFLLSELFLIAGWVIIWEIIYDLLFNEIKRKRKNKIYRLLANCKIDYHN